MNVTLEGREYTLEFDKRDPFVSPAFDVAFCDELALRYKPIIIDPKGHGKQPVPPEFMAYRLVYDERHHRLCIIYEVYWTRQDCSWRQFNKDHEHDYEQIQIHFNLQHSSLDRVVIASAGPPRYGGHGVEVYRHVKQVRSGAIRRKTSSFESFPWGRHTYEIWVLDQPLYNLVFIDQRPIVRISNCFHVFTGIKWNQWQYHRRKSKRRNPLQHELTIPLCRLDRRILWQWYYQHHKNPLGHDLSNPFTPPHILYYPSPSEFGLRFLFTLVGFITSIIRTLTGR
ncbi:MAG: hypothetical protein Q6364_03415 [Candidatus Hermodarchaeota archaeon]|nr:hypothetical protein [Candidatus Hermodarchaeota archaeon]